MEPKYETHFEKIIGGTEQDKETAHRALQEWFENKNTLPRPFELKKTENDKKIIAEVETEVDYMVGYYGGTPKPFPLERIYVVRPGSMRHFAGGEFEKGFHSPLGQYVAVERGESDLQFALILAHELLHLKSPKLAGVVNHPETKSDWPDIRLYRSGLTMIERDKEKKRGQEVRHFAILEEVIVAEVADRLYQSRMKDSSLFADEIQGIDEIKIWLRKALRLKKLTPAEENKHQMEVAELRTIPRRNLMEILSILRNSEFDNVYKANYLWNRFQAFKEQEQIGLRERLAERKKFDELREEIWQASQNKFRQKEDVFRMFAKANFTGQYLEIARLIEEALGKGAFRRVGREFGITPGQTSPNN